MLECCMWQEGEVGSELVAVPSRDSDNSSGHSTPEVRHRGAVSSHPQGAGGGLDPTRPHSQALDNPLYANLEHMQDKAKPPVPPRGGSTSNRSSRSSLGEEGPIYQNRISVVPSYEVSAPENTYQNYPSDRPNGHRRDPSENMNGEGSTHHPDLTDGVPGSRQPYSEYTSRTMSLPQGSSLPPAGSVHTGSGPIPSHRNSATIDRQGLSESSSEGDVPVSTNKKEKEKKGSVFKFFGRRKGAQV